MSLTHQFLLTGTAASAATNKGTSGGLATWVNYAGGASTPFAINSQFAALGPANSLNTGLVLTGDFTILLAAKFGIETGYNGYWGIDGNSLLRNNFGGNANVFWESAPLVPPANAGNHHMLEPGWGVIALSMAANVGSYILPGRVSRLVSHVRNFTTFAGNTDSLIFGGSGWAAGYGKFDAAEVRVYDSALTEAHTLEKIEEMQVRMRSIGLEVL